MSQGRRGAAARSMRARRARREARPGWDTRDRVPAQVLQLIWGGRDPALRDPTHARRAGGAGRGRAARRRAAADLADAYASSATSSTGCRWWPTGRPTGCRRTPPGWPASRRSWASPPRCSPPPSWGTCPGRAPLRELLRDRAVAERRGAGRRHRQPGLHRGGGRPGRPGDAEARSASPSRPRSAPWCGPGITAGRGRRGERARELLTG